MPSRWYLSPIKRVDANAGFRLRPGRFCNRSGQSNQLELIGFDPYRGRLVDEIQAQQNRTHAKTTLDPPLQTLQRPGLDAHKHPFADGRSQPDIQARVQCTEDALQLARECLLVKDVKHIRNMIMSLDDFLAPGLKLQEHIPREQRLAEHHRLSAVFMDRLVTRQCDRGAPARTPRSQFLFATGFCVDHVPKHFRHAKRIRRRLIGVKMGKPNSLQPCTKTDCRVA